MSVSAQPCIDLRFLCLARNCEKTVPMFLNYLHRLESEGFACSAIVGENGSIDRTHALLESAVTSRFRVEDTGFMAAVPSRLRRMAMGRQKLLDLARADQPREQYVCVADLDNVMLEPPSPVLVREALAVLEADGRLFAVGATSHPFYYDLLSLRADGHDYSQLNDDIAAAQKHPLTYHAFHKRRIYRNQMTLSAREPVLCASSFNGFCLYRAEDYFKGNYRAADEANVCEHVNLNLSIARATGKRMLISPSLSVTMPADHAPVGLWRFWTDRIVRRLKRLG